jgi:glutamyl-tRNA synthetase
MARSNGGKFILRIEDTDMKRNTPTAMQQVIDDLKWLGIEWDEGPGVEGPNGPYLQSERRDIYDKYIGQLLDEKKAYYCFDTTEELKAMRDKAEKEKKNFQYPRPAVFPTEADVEKARAEGKPVIVRFAMPDTDITVTDTVRGEVTFTPEVLSDFVIQKSDGFPTYHLAVVVDDELMGVTHVIRGQEHLMNTPGHQVLQDGLGFKRPTYAHMSVTVSDSGGKLSKRERPKALKQAIKAAADVDLERLASESGLSDEDMQKFLKGKSVPDMPVIDAMAEFLGVHLPEINVVDFLKSGYVPEGMVNFLALLGWNPGNDREVMPLEELISCFDISRLAKTNSLFDRKKLVSFNTEHLRKLDKEKLLGYFKDYIKLCDSPLCKADDDMLRRVLSVTEGARTFEDVEVKTRFAFIGDDEVEYDPKMVKKVLMKHDGLAVLEIVGQRLAGLDEVTPESIEGVLRGLAEEREVGLGKVAQPLRVAICGNTVSPAIFDSVDMLGMEKTLKRIENTLNKFKSTETSLETEN